MVVVCLFALLLLLLFCGCFVRLVLALILVLVALLLLSCFLPHPSTPYPPVYLLGHYTSLRHVQVSTSTGVLFLGPLTSAPFTSRPPPHTHRRTHIAPIPPPPPHPTSSPSPFSHPRGTAQSVFVPCVCLQYQVRHSGTSISKTHETSVDFLKTIECSSFPCMT